MTADAAEGQVTRRMRRRWKALIALLVIFVIAVVGLWTQRRTLAEGFVDRELVARGVPARYTIADIGLSAQRLENVVIGDPASPDLVADWVEVRTELGLGGAKLSGIVAGQVRIRARLIDGRLSFGAIDKLLPPPSGKPFALPSLDTQVSDARLRIETPYGVLGAKLSGSGQLDDGFSGRLALVGDHIDVAGCGVDRLRGAFGLRIAGGRPTIEGPTRAAAIACGETQAAGVAADLAVTLGAALDRWTGRTRATTATLASPVARTGRIIARATFDGTARGTAGDISVTAMQALADAGRAGTIAVNGRYRVGTAGLEFAGRTQATQARASDRWLAAIGGLGDSAAGTPVGPLAVALSRAGVAAARDMSLDGAVEAVMRGEARAIRVGDLTLSSASGARATVGGPLLRFGAVEMGGRVTLGGGGLPQASVDLAQVRGGLSGRAIVQPYAAGGARLALTPVTFRAVGGALTQVTTLATLSGPLADGRVEDLRMPIDARWRGASVAVNTACTPVAWQRLSVSSLTLDPTRLTLCPTGPALMTLDRGRLGGGARLGGTRLTGRIGSTPLTLAASGADLRLADMGFVLTGVESRLGAPARVTRIDAARLTGRVSGGAVAGQFSGAAGQIANVPLLLSEASGDWSFARGKLSLGGQLNVADSAAERRFVPLTSRNIALTLVGNRIEAGGTLTHPTKGVRVAEVAIRHDLSRGTGGATLDVPLIRFDDAFQPNELTPVTFGVIADVKGEVSGKGRIDWTPAGVTSSGRFATSGTDLAAAFGPVTGIKGEIVFTDLLGLVSAPGQVATIATVNPGIAVENGTVRYQLVGDNRVRVEGGSWPFANGRLLLDPTLLDFSGSRERRMTFHVEAVDAAAFLQQFDFDNLNATGTFDGVLPMVFDDTGGRIVDGRLSARAGGGNIAYVGTLTKENLGVWGDMAFQALKSMNYRKLDITMNGPLAGEMVTTINFAGISQGAGTKSNFLIRRIERLPFVFNITITAPFRQIVDSVKSYYDPSRLIERNLPALLEQRRRREQDLAPKAPLIQPTESEKRP